MSLRETEKESGVCVCACVCFKEPRANNLIGMCKFCLSLRQLLGLLPLEQVVKKNLNLVLFSKGDLDNHSNS